jgi:Ca2+-binding RTX toxin-like protein
MNDLIRAKGSPAMRPASWLAPWALMAALGIAGAVAAIVAAPVHAEAVIRAEKAPQSSKEAKFKHPKLVHGLLTIEGTEASDKIALRLQAGRPDLLDVEVGDDSSAGFSFKREKIAEIAVAARGGDDLVRIDEGNGPFTDGIATTIDGEDGNDTIAGGRGVETLLGGDGNDSIDANGGNDLALMGSGDDLFIWDPGDGSDVVEGQAGSDTMLFNGAAVAEQVDLSANGSRLRLFRSPGNITMDTAGIERVDFTALGGADDIAVDDLTGTDVSDVNLDLASTLGGATGDDQADRVVVTGTNGDDSIDVSGDAEVVKVNGPAASTEILHSEVANDRLEINTLAGADAVDSSGLAAGAIQLLVDGVLVP